MPIYVYKHPEKEEYVEVLQGMKDEHSYKKDGLAWERVFLAPNASFDSDADPFSGRQFVDATAAKKYSDARNGTKHPQQIKDKGYESKNVKIDYD